MRESASPYDALSLFYFGIIPVFINFVIIFTIPDFIL